MPPPPEHSRHTPTPQAGDNAVVVGHSLTSNSNVAEWWGAILGDGDGFSLDTSSDYVVCCNYLGSPYGSSSPVTSNPDKPSGECYAADFPTPVTVRDNVRLQRMLLDHLGVRHLRMAIGGSMVRGKALRSEQRALNPETLNPKPHPMSESTKYCSTVDATAAAQWFSPLHVRSETRSEDPLPPAPENGSRPRALVSFDAMRCHTMECSRAAM